MAARATEAVIKIEMAERRVQIVAPHQNHDAATEPNAFLVPGGAIDRLRCLDEFIGLALAVLGDVGRGGGSCRGGFAGLILGAKVTALGDRASNADQQRESAGD